MGDCLKEVNCWKSVLPGTYSFKCTWLDDQEIQGTILSERGCLEEFVSWTPELVLSSVTAGRSEVDVDFVVYYWFEESRYLLSKCLFSGRYYKWISRVIEENVMLVSGIKKSLYGQAKAACLWYEEIKKCFFRSWFCGEKCGSLYVHVQDCDWNGICGWFSVLGMFKI